MMKWKLRVSMDLATRPLMLTVLMLTTAVKMQMVWGVNTIVGDFDTTYVRETILKYQIVQEHWKKLYSVETSLRLQDAVKKHV